MGEYVQAGGLKTWYDSWGSGSPIVLLHGGFVTNATWEPLVPQLAKSFNVIAPERRGHGHTPDVEGPITYDLMAQDTIAFLDTVVRQPADLVGWSDGGNVGLIVAAQRPDLVRKLVPISANFDDTGAVPAAADSMTSMTADSPNVAFFRSQYEAVSPDGPSHWPVVFEKIKQMISSDIVLDRKGLGSITAPTLVVASDDDIISLEHTVELYRSIPDAQLLILPGTSHGLIMEKPNILAGLITDFLVNDPVPTMMPIRRAVRPQG
jgi:pimeloyl-ACP methyl ester carboxylesterase